MAPRITGKPKFTAHGPGPYTRRVYAAIAAGQLGMPGTGGNLGKIGPASANAMPFGVATTPGLPAGTSPNFTSPSGFPGLDVAMPDDEVAFARHGAFLLLATGTFADGDFVKCGANGSVVKWDPAADQSVPHVGACVDPAGGVNGSPSLIELAIG